MIILQVRLILGEYCKVEFDYFRSGSCRILHKATSPTSPCHICRPTQLEPRSNRMHPQRHVGRRSHETFRRRRRRWRRSWSSAKTRHETLLQLHSRSRSHCGRRMSTSSPQHAHIRRNLLPTRSRPKKTFNTFWFLVFSILWRYSPLSPATATRYDIFWRYFASPVAGRDGSRDKSSRTSSVLYDCGEEPDDSRATAPSTTDCSTEIAT